MTSSLPPVINFAAGPSKLPEEVIANIAAELESYQGKGISILCMSHRSADFLKIINKAQEILKQLLGIPDNYKILFLQGGGTGQFSAVPMNLLRTGTADYVVTGTWSDKASKEAKKYMHQVNLVAPKPQTFTSIPDRVNWKLTDGADYLYYCANETVHGVEFHETPLCPDDVTLVSDMSSNFLSRQIDVSKYGLIFAGAQKNVGPAGVVVAIIREDLLKNELKNPQTPLVLDYADQAKNNSVANTPCTFGIYALELVLEWILNQGGLEEMERRSREKAALIYDVIDASAGFYSNPVAPLCRSRMNIPFRVGGPDGNPGLETEFLARADKAGMKNLKGHRSVGGIRASLYNAITVEETRTLRDFMIQFQQDHVGSPV